MSLSASSGTLRKLWAGARPPQWIKNTFVFLPIIFGRSIVNADAWRAGLHMFVVFCIAASAVYLWNDVADAATDRLHPVKRSRPVASGALSARSAVFFSVIGMAAALAGGYARDARFGHLIALYLALNLLYTAWLRDFVIIDVFCIAFFYVLRIISAPLVLQISFSFWMIILTALLALFMALNKRRFELASAAANLHEGRSTLKDYSAYYIDQMCAAITASILVVYMLYTLDGRQIERFHSHNLMYTIPFVWYGLFRYQYLVFEKGDGGDPARIILSDRSMLWNLLLWALLCAAAVHSQSDWLPFIIS